MQKIYPYIFPVVALFFVLLLLFRWYSLRTQREGMTSLLNDQVTIEELSADDERGLMVGTGDYSTVELKGEDPTMLGEVRYEVTDGQLLFSVDATLPFISSGRYQVWLRQPEGAAQRKAFALSYGKAGYIGSASVDASTLPLEVVISRELTDDSLLEEVLLTGTMSAETK
jgi:hypothetical protein